MLSVITICISYDWLHHIYLAFDLNVSSSHIQRLFLLLEPSEELAAAYVKVPCHCLPESATTRGNSYPSSEPALWHTLGAPAYSYLSLPEVLYARLFCETSRHNVLPLNYLLPHTLPDLLLGPYSPNISELHLV